VVRMAHRAIAWLAAGVMPRRVVGMLLVRAAAYAKLGSKLMNREDGTFHVSEQRAEDAVPRWVVGIRLAGTTVACAKLRADLMKRENGTRRGAGEAGWIRRAVGGGRDAPGRAMAANFRVVAPTAPLTPTLSPKRGRGRRRRALRNRGFSPMLRPRRAAIQDRPGWLGGALTMARETRRRQPMPAAEFLARRSVNQPDTQRDTMWRGP
jgi:hypothetical protein